MAQFLIIGLNALGRNLARELHRREHQLKLADASQDRINRMCHEIPDVVRLDTTDKEALRELNIPRFDHVIVCMGHRFEDAERTTLALKDLEARKVTNVATTIVRARILKEIGADQVVTPGLEVSRNLAVALDDERMESFVYVDREVGVAEVAVVRPITLPDDWRGFLGDDCVVTGIRRQSTEGGKAEIAHLAQVALEVGDHLIVYGRPAAISACLDRVFR